MDHAQYFLLLAACLVLTLPLEVVFGVRVWRRPLRLVAAVVPAVVVFSLWDVAAIAHHHWRFNARYVTGWNVPGHLPLEEVAFFVVIPICALLTFETVSRLLADGPRPLWARRRRASGGPGADGRAGRD